MEIGKLHSALTEAGFREEKMDTGINYSISLNHIELICYYEPNIELQFVSIYKWNDNDVKGTYNIPVQRFHFDKDSVPQLFEKTLGNMPEYIGDKANTHIEVRKAIEEIFGEN